MRFTHSLRRRGLQVLALAATCSITSLAAYGCSQATPPTPERKAGLLRMKRTFERMKALQKGVEARVKPQDSGTAAPFSMVGLWMTTFTADGEIVDAGFDVWHADGTQLLNDNPPPVTGNVCVGVWQQTGPLTYELKHPSWAFDPDTSSTVIGITYILEKITLDPGGDKFTGSASLEGYDLDGNHVYHQEASVSGDRIKADPLADAGPLPQMRLYPYVRSRK